MADGWLFRLRSTLGAPQAAPAWPASDPRLSEPTRDEARRPGVAIDSPRPTDAALGDERQR